MKYTIYNPKPYRASLTREQFLFHEMRTTARLLNDDLSDEQAVDAIIKDNLFQYPTGKSVRGMARACVKRLRNMHNDTLITAIAEQPQEVAKQICLYALMKDHRLVLDFMVTVVGGKYRQQDMSFSKLDINIFFLRLQEQDDGVASWGDSTITKIKQILARILVENDYLDTVNSKNLNPVFLFPILRDAILANGDDVMLPAFNCFN